MVTIIMLFLSLTCFPFFLLYLCIELNHCDGLGFGNGETDALGLS